MKQLTIKLETKYVELLIQAAARNSMSLEEYAVNCLVKYAFNVDELRDSIKVHRFIKKGVLRKQ